MENLDWNLIGFNLAAYVVTLSLLGAEEELIKKVDTPMGKLLLGFGHFCLYLLVMTGFSTGAGYYEYTLTRSIYLLITSLGGIYLIFNIFKISKEVDWRRILNFLISPLLLGIYVFLLILVLSVIYIPLVNQLWISLIHILSIGLGWLTATLFILSYIGLVVFLIMIFALKSDGRTKTGWKDNYTASGSGSIFLYSIGAIVIGIIIREISTMPTWCEGIMCM